MFDSRPDADDIAALFQRLREGDPVARSGFIEAVLDPLVSYLRAWRRDADDAACLTAAEDAVLDLIRNPAIFDPAKCALIGFLHMSAKGDLLNELKKESRHHRKRESIDCVELAADGGNTSADEHAADLPSFDDPDIAATIAGFTATEHAVLDLMRAGEKATAAFAAALGIDALPADEQAREVKQAKDRIKLRLKRMRRKT